APRLQVWLGVIILGVYAVLHGQSALEWYQKGLPVGLWSTSILNSAGCAVAAFGLASRRIWGRCFALAIALLGLTELAAAGAILPLTRGMPLPWGFGGVQVLAFAALLVA